MDILNGNSLIMVLWVVVTGEWKIRWGRKHLELLDPIQAKKNWRDLEQGSMIMSLSLAVGTIPRLVLALRDGKIAR